MTRQNHCVQCDYKTYSLFFYSIITRLVIYLLSFCVLLHYLSPVFSQESERIPIIYSTDLYQPPVDPDDHFDLAMLFALNEFDLKAIIFDISTAHREPQEHGISALKQIEAITKRSAPPHAIGLRYPLNSPGDTAIDQPAEFQNGVELLLNTLRNAEQKVVLFLVGSCRDFAVAYNREPELLKSKVKAVYVNAGNGIDGLQNEWNVTLDPNAYEGLMLSGLPIYWCPCFMNRFSLAEPEEIEAGKAFLTYYVVPNQAELLEKVSPELKNYFFYALNRLTDEPIEYLKNDPEPLPTTERNMWCTGPFLHAAGREIYKTTAGKFIACSPEKAKTLGLAENKIDVFQFVPVCLKCEDRGAQPLPILKGTLENDSTTKIFRYINKDYNEILCLVLSDLLEQEARSK